MSNQPFSAGGLIERRDALLKVFGLVPETVVEKLTPLWFDRIGPEIDWACSVDKARARVGRWVTSKLVFETRKGEKVPLGTRGRFVEHATDGEDRVVWVLFPGFGLAAARVPRTQESVVGKHVQVGGFWVPSPGEGHGGGAADGLEMLPCCRRSV